MDKDLVGMAREVDRLRAEVSNAEKWPTAPNMYGGPYMNQEFYPPIPLHATGGDYGDGHENYHHDHMGVGGAVEGMIPYGGGHPGIPIPPRGKGGPPPYNNSRT